MSDADGAVPLWHQLTYRTDHRQGRAPLNFCFSSTRQKEEQYLRHAQSAKRSSQTRVSIPAVQVTITLKTGDLDSREADGIDCLYDRQAGV